MRTGEEAGTLIGMHGVRWLLVVAVGSSACFMDQATMGNEDDGDESGSDLTSTTGGSTDAETTTSPSTSSTTMDPTTESTTGDTITDSTPTDSMPTVTDTMPGECAMGEVCLPIGDGEWAGPIAAQFVSANAPRSDCPVGWGQGPVALIGLDVPPFNCICSCPDQPDVTCSFLFAFNDAAGCNGRELGSDVGVEMECVTDTDVGIGGVSVQDFGSTATCGGAVWPEPSPPTWAERIDGCVPPLGESCPLGQCVPRPPMEFGGPLCITREGEHACPEGPFEVRHVAYAGFDDERTCDCECVVTSVSCSGNVVVSSTEACGDEIAAGLVGGCLDAATDIHSVSVASSRRRHPRWRADLLLHAALSTVSCPPWRRFS